MISGPELRAALALLPGGVPEKERDADVWRMREGFHGPVTLANGIAPTHLYVGARSGLEALATLSRRPRSQVVVVERQPERRARLGPVLEAFPGGRAVPDLSDALDLLGGRRIGFARVDSAFCDAEALGHLADIGVDWLCGTFCQARIDPVALYRMSRDRVARAFFWRAESGGPGFGSDAGAVGTEVSVVVPACNAADWLGKALESLAAQSLAKLEVVVVDDGSTDETGTIADAWAAREPRIRVIRQAKAGPASARNAGIAASRGEFVGFLDARDRADPRMFEELYRAAILRGAEIAQCGYAEVAGDGGIARYEDAANGDQPNGLTGVARDNGALLMLRPSIWRRIYRRDFLNANGIVFPPHVLCFEDLPFQFEAISRARRIALLPDAWYFHARERPEKESPPRDEGLFVHFDLFDWMQDRLGGWMDAKLERQFFRMRLSTHLWALGQLRPPERRAYLRRARRQLMSHRVHLDAADCLVVAARSGRGALKLVMGALATGRGQ